MQWGQVGIEIKGDLNAKRSNLSILKEISGSLLQVIFLTQGSNSHLLYLLQWQAGSWPLVPPGKLQGEERDWDSIPKPTQFSLVTQSCPTLCDPMNCSQASLSITNSRSLPKPMSIELMMPSNHLILCYLLLPSVFPSIRVFSNESALHIRWPKDWSFSFNISPSSEYPGLISFRMDWLDLLVVISPLISILTCPHWIIYSILQFIFGI